MSIDESDKIKDEIDKSLDKKIPLPNPDQETNNPAYNAKSSSSNDTIDHYLNSCIKVSPLIMIPLTIASGVAASIIYGIGPEIILPITLMVGGETGLSAIFHYLLKEDES